jgi:hypothetical protein
MTDGALRRYVRRKMTAPFCNLRALYTIDMARRPRFYWPATMQDTYAHALRERKLV